MSVFFKTHFEFAEGGKVPKWVLAALWPRWVERLGDWELREQLTDSIKTPSQIATAVGKSVEGWTGQTFRPHGGTEMYRNLRLLPNPETEAFLADYAELLKKPWPVDK